jgi:hypothetical protein
MSHGGKVLGTFCMYSRDIRCPEPSDIQLIDYAARVAGIAIERHRMEMPLMSALKGSWIRKSNFGKSSIRLPLWCGGLSLRFARAIAADLGVSRYDIRANVMGEHGSAMVPLWRSVELMRDAPRVVDCLAGLCAQRRVAFRDSRRRTALRTK